MRRLFFAAPALLLLACSDAAHPDEASETSGVGGGAQTSVGAVPACVTSAVAAFNPTRCAHTADSLDDALGRVRLDRCSAGLTPAELSESLLDASDPRMIPSARSAAQTPLALPPYGVTTATALDAAMDSPAPVTRAILDASAIRGTSIGKACVSPEWYAPSLAEAPLAGALAQIRGREDLDIEEVQAVPIELQRALVPIVRAIASTNAEIVQARGDVASEHIAAISSIPSWVLGVRHFEWSDAVPKAFEAIDIPRISRAAANLALVIESANLARFKGVELAPLSLVTPAGRIVLRGPSNGRFDASGDAPAFLLDTGGDDTYIGEIASGSLDRPVSVLVDLDGRDTYSYEEVGVPSDHVGKRLPSDGEGRSKEGRTFSRVGRQGSGVLGVGVLFDLGSNSDTYRSLVASQGVGSHGVGVLFDAGGSDRYESEGFSQGAAAWGLGLLLDAAGDDHYALYNSGQGFGFTQGVGAIVDRRGNDVYWANPGDASLDGDILYPSDQLTGPPNSPIVANHSFAQGVGAGHRPDWPDPGYPFPGGVGILRDAAGRDRYTAGVFAQGAGFVQGMGMLLEGTGDDVYEGLYYAQGAAAHMALALFRDDAGNDEYNTHYPIQLSSIGLAHDFSVAIHYDADGNDKYVAPALSLGTSLANGISLFVNNGGDDYFDAPKGSALGIAATGEVRKPRERLPTIGVFVKAGGRGSYSVDENDEPRGGRRWCEGKEDDELERSVGIDAPGGRARL